jgi:hypothetical protein
MLVGSSEARRPQLPRLSLNGLMPLVSSWLSQSGGELALAGKAPTDLV